MQEVSPSLRDALESVVVPGLDISLKALAVPLEATSDGAQLSVALSAPVPGTARERLGEALRQAGAQAGCTSVSIDWRPGVLARVVGDDDPVPECRNVVLVMSGKGGVGKSTVATNLALALTRLGARVGLLDADIYGPSIPTMLGTHGPPMSDGKRIRPLERFGLKLMSMGFLLESDRSAVMWRGPMLHGALMQFLSDVDWGPLDYLLLDLPPGTGDIAITLSQKLQSNGAVVVTTPQEVALQDVYKAVAMNQKVGIPVLGVVENHSYFVCDGCSKRHELFGAGGGAKVAEMAEAPLLGQLPLDPSVGQWGDAGTPVVEAAPGSPAGKAFLEVAERLAVRIALQNAANRDGFTIDRSGGVNRRLPVMR